MMPRRKLCQKLEYTISYIGAHPEMSNPAVAQELGVGLTTVRIARSRLRRAQLAKLDAQPERAKPERKSSRRPPWIIDAEPILRGGSDWSDLMYFKMDDAFCRALRQAAEAGLENPKFAVRRGQ